MTAGEVHEHIVQTQLSTRMRHVWLMLCNMSSPMYYGRVIESVIQVRSIALLAAWMSDQFTMYSVFPIFASGQT
jgi:hypothetical protein